MNGWGREPKKPNDTAWLAVLIGLSCLGIILLVAYCEGGGRR